MSIYSPLFVPSYEYEAVTTSDTVNLTKVARGFYIGVSGNVVLVLENGATVTFKAVPVGILPVRAKRVNATSTTATDIVALY